MTLFPQWFVTALIFAGLGVTCGGAVGLLVLLVLDWKRGTLW